MYTTVTRYSRIPHARQEHNGRELARRAFNSRVGVLLQVRRLRRLTGRAGKQIGFSGQILRRRLFSGPTRVSRRRPRQSSSDCEYIILRELRETIFGMCGQNVSWIILRLGRRGVLAKTIVHAIFFYFFICLKTGKCPMMIIIIIFFFL